MDCCEWISGTNRQELLEIGIPGNDPNCQTLEEAMQQDTPDGSDYKTKQLFNRHGFNLAIMKGHVKGVREAFDPNAVLQLIPVGVGEVKIKSIESGFYLAMNNRGQLYAEEDEANDATVFLENVHGHYLTYMSKKFAHFGWYVGITKDGRGKSGRKTWHPWGQKAIQFVARRPYAEPHPLRQIENRHNMTLLVMEDGTVKGLSDQDQYPSSGVNKNAILEFIPTKPPGAFRIRGVEANLYLAMDSKGKLYGESDRTNGATLFAEHSMGSYYVYLSVHYAHLGWHIGIKKSGKAKMGKKTAYPPKQKAIQFKRKPVVPPGFEAKGLDWTHKLDLEGAPGLSFIDEEEGNDGVTVTGPKQVGKIPKGL